MKVNQSPTTPIQSAQTGEATGAKKSAKTSAAQAAYAQSSASTEGAAKTEISAKAREMAKAKSVAQQTPDVREEKVAEIKRRLAEGRYKVDPQAVADRMVDEHLKTGGLS